MGHSAFNTHKTALLFTLLLLFFAAPLKGTANSGALLQRLYEKIERGDFSLGDCTASLYVKQTVEIEKRNIGLDFIPTLTRFDKDERHYLSEMFYDIRIMEHSLPALKRKALLTSHRRSNGEMDIVTGFIAPALFQKKIMRQGFLSPIHRSNSAYYEFSTDTSYNGEGFCKINFTQRFDNVKLLKRGWFILDADCNVSSIYLEGSDEECSFCAEYRMGREYKNLLQSVQLSLQYDFAGNRLGINTDAIYSYYAVYPMQPAHKRKEEYNLSTAVDTNFITLKADDAALFVAEHRPLPLTPSDSMLYAQKELLEAGKSKSDEDDILWTIGDGMVSAHSFEWGGSNIRMTPIINPSYLSYSSSRGLSYKMKLHLMNSMSKGREFSFTPIGGYNFKQGAFYWDIDTRFLFDPLHMGTASIDIGSGNRTFSSIVLDRIENSATDSLAFDKWDIHYFKHLYINATVRRELLNGLELSVGTKFHRRSIVGRMPTGADESTLKSVYRQLAPHLCVTWQPGMYYYIKDGRKINIGSRMPRFSLDVEQGISKVFGSDGAYTRAEADVQYNMPMNGDAHLYLRVGGGGYFHTNDVYFADYAFLRENNLPVERSDELGGVFQLLDSEWYNAAKKYFRAHATYESPFFILQRLLPKARIIKNERIYANVLFMSHLTPYTEFGYGVDTPYADVGFFVSCKNHKFHSVGYKITLSLFRD